MELNKPYILINWFTDKCQSFSEDELNEQINSLLLSDPIDYKHFKQKTTTEAVIENSPTHLDVLRKWMGNT